ncbi:MAG: hypothetical protein M1816_005697 [Peltula sp. TS41687]|nr:MAG: hypothetical protein M1816_005697 [Peltula sp. TS41687]
MFFFFVCGSHESKPTQSSAPLSKDMKALLHNAITAETGQEVGCPVCNFVQDIKNRPDVQSQHPGAAAPQAHVMPPGGGHAAYK